jgi:hypothetical protein
LAKGYLYRVAVGRRRFHRPTSGHDHSMAAGQLDIDDVIRAWRPEQAWPSAVEIGRANALPIGDADAMISLVRQFGRLQDPSMRQHIARLFITSEALRRPGDRGI